MPCGGVDYLVNSGYWECVFGVGVIEVIVIHTNSPFFVLFRDHHNVGQPFRVLNFLNKPRREKFVDLLFDYVTMLRVEAP